MNSQAPTTDELRSIHQTYCQLTGLDIPFTMRSIYHWEQFWVRGYTPADLRMVVAYLKRRIRSGRRQIESLAMRNMLANLDYFAEDLALARALARVRAPDPERRSVLAATGRSESLNDHATKTPGQILAGLNALLGKVSANPPP